MGSAAVTKRSPNAHWLRHLFVHVTVEDGCSWPRPRSPRGDNGTPIPSCVHSEGVGGQSTEEAQAAPSKSQFGRDTHHFAYTLLERIESHGHTSVPGRLGKPFGWDAHGLSHALHFSALAGIFLGDTHDPLTFPFRTPNLSRPANQTLEALLGDISCVRASCRCCFSRSIAYARNTSSGKKPAAYEIQRKEWKVLRNGGPTCYYIAASKSPSGSRVLQAFEGLIAKAERSEIKSVILLVLGFPRTTSKRLVALLPECH